MNYYEASISGLKALVPEGSITLGWDKLGQDGLMCRAAVIPVIPGDGNYFRVGLTPQGLVLGHCRDHPGYFLVVEGADGLLAYTTAGREHIRGAGYKARKVKGYPPPEVLFTRFGAWGDAGDPTLYQVNLLRVWPGAAFRQRGESGNERTFVAYADGLRSYTKAEWDAALRQWAEEDGDVRWL